MKTASKTIKINEAKYLDGYRLSLLFSDGKNQVIDFGPFLQKSTHPEVRKFLTVKYFKAFELTGGDLMWGDFDLIFPIMDLYHARIDHTQNAPDSQVG